MRSKIFLGYSGNKSAQAKNYCAIELKPAVSISVVLKIYFNDKDENLTIKSFLITNELCTMKYIVFFQF